jgi:antitoxin (DNA-binding transcriptional repressor) of toxin-antitoxin stability system
MTIQIDVAADPKLEDLVDELERTGGEISLTRDGRTVAKLVRSESAPATDSARAKGRVLYKGEWVSAAGAKREQALEHLRGSVTIHGDIVSPIDDLEWDALK